MERAAHDLDVPREEGFLRRDWMAQRIGAVLFGAVLAAAALGVLGGGPVSGGEAGVEGLSVRYERFVRRSAATEVVVRAETGGVGGVVVELGGTFFREADVELVWPRPRAEEWSGIGARLEVATGDGGVCEIRARVKPRGAGRRVGTVRVGGRAVEFMAVVYP